MYHIMIHNPGMILKKFKKKLIIIIVSLHHYYYQKSIVIKFSFSLKLKISFLFSVHCIYFA